MVATKSVVERYGLDPTFEARAVVLSCCRPTFYGAVGHAVEPDRLTSPACGLLMRAAHAYAADVGTGPADATLVMQRLRRWLGEGKHTHEEIMDAIDVLTTVTLVDVDERAYAAELVPVIKRRIREDTVRTAIDEFGRPDGDFARTEQAIQKARRLGSHDTSTGRRLGKGSAAEIERMRHAERLRTGIFEIDAGMGGGMPRGRVGMWLAGTGTGKSTALIGQSGVAMIQGALIAYATLELPVHEVEARIVAWHTGFPTTAILEGNCPDAWTKFEGMMPGLGGFYARDWPAGKTTVADLLEWCKQLEQQERRALDLLVIDYADKLSTGDVKADSNSYHAMKRVYEALLDSAKATGRWIWTASQAKGRSRKERGDRLEAEDQSDSQHKSRTADVVISASFERDKGQDEINLYVAKNRCGRGLFGCGPLPTAFECSRLVADHMPV